MSLRRREGPCCDEQSISLVSACDWLFPSGTWHNVTCARVVRLHGVGCMCGTVGFAFFIVQSVPLRTESSCMQR